jgi:hypothetical protein
MDGICSRSKSLCGAVNSFAQLRLNLSGFLYIFPFFLSDLYYLITWGMKICKFLLAILLMSIPIIAQNDSSWIKNFPLKHRALIQFKGGYSKDQINSKRLIFWAAGGEYRTKPVYFSNLGGGYFQMVFPAMLYHFPSKDAFTVDLKCRPDMGPPLARWLPLGMVDVGYLFSSRDWLSGIDKQLQSLMLGGWFMIPLKIPADGIIMVSGSKSVAGDQFIRFSCYAHWFFNSNFGITIHGDNFIRNFNGIKAHIGSINMGVLFRI